MSSTARDPTLTFRVWKGSIRQSDSPAAAEAARAEQLRFFQFGQDDINRLTDMRERLAAELPRVVHDFAEHLSHFAEPGEALAAVDRAVYEANLRQYVDEILSANFSDAHLAHRSRIGLAHGPTGLDHLWYVGSYRFLERALARVLVQSAPTPEQGAEERATLAKVLAIDLGLVMEAHVQEFMHALDERTEQLREQNRELERQRELRTGLAQMLVHDMAGPLNTVITAIGLLSREATSELTQELLVVVQRNNRRLRGMLQDILDVYRSDATAFEIAPSRVNLRAVAADVLAEYGIGGVTHPRYELTAGPDLPRVWADEALVVRVLRNLLDNATKYTPDDGRVTVVVEPAAGGAWVDVWVEDTGEGIPVAHRECIFDPYFTDPMSDDPDIRSRRRGIGLGLAFCKRVIEAHGGVIRVEPPRGGRGAAFRFTLPVASEEPARP